jgi:hypothetical protein
MAAQDQRFLQKNRGGLRLYTTSLGVRHRLRLPAVLQAFGIAGNGSSGMVCPHGNTIYIEDTAV